MPVYVNTEILLKSNYKELVRGKNYEKILLDIINDSSLLLPGVFKKICDQSHGEPDFYNVKTNEKYEAKILFYQEMCYHLRQNKLEEWKKLIMEMLNEVYGHSSTDQLYEDTGIYKEMNTRFDKIEDDENCILFFPYPILEFSDSLVCSVGLNSFEIIYKEIVSKRKNLLNKKSYVIYPNIENKTVILYLNEHKKEYLDKNYFLEYIEVLNVGID